MIDSTQKIDDNWSNEMQHRIFMKRAGDLVTGEVPGEIKCGIERQSHYR